MKMKTILILVLLALTVVFIFQNSAMVKIQFFFWSIEMNRIIMIGGLLLVGCVIGYLFAATKTARKPESAVPQSPKTAD
jgi:uncharacterized integral membrane protein